MDYWQRFIEMNRFIFQLNAHLFSEAYKLQFADLTNRYEEIYHSHQMSHELNLQQEALAQDLHSQTLQVESSLQELSYQLEPLYNLSTRIVRIGKSTWGVIKETAETSEELTDTFLLLFLALIYLAFYLLVHLSTAFILSQYNVYGWFRTVLAAAMLIDWIVWFPNEFRLLFLVLGSLPISIVINARVSSLMITPQFKQTYRFPHPSTGSTSSPFLLHGANPSSAGVLPHIQIHPSLTPGS